MVTKAKYTYEDYLNTPEGERYELIDGELILVASPNEEHQFASIRLGSRMYFYVDEGELGWVFQAPFDIVFSDTEVVQPDIMFISKEREHIRTGANVRGAPDLVVEILSPSSLRRDWGYKRELYAKYGVKEYWIADPVHKMVSVMLLKDGVLELAGTYVEGDTVASTALEGFGVGVSEIF
ncbi:MAG: Uma2 family endonuclease [Dehalococcoidia bacterium]|nr:Uma2 family endonuclease [Dehalococcoidia bacterium]